MDISVAEVIAAVDENVDTTRCGGAHNCQANGPCLTHDLWQDLSDRIYDYLHHISLRDLVERKGVQEVLGHPDRPSPEVALGDRRACRVPAGV
jgi:Rrf2 family iron-sulfur cluster assembly transcriptional regulator